MVSSLEKQSEIFFLFLFLLQSVFQPVPTLVCMVSLPWVINPFFCFIYLTECLWEIRFSEQLIISGISPLKSCTLFFFFFLQIKQEHPINCQASSAAAT